MGFAAEAGLFFGGGKRAFCPKKECNAPSAGYRFPRKKAVFFGRRERGRFAQKKGVTLHPLATDFQEKKILRKLNQKKSHSEYFAPPTYIGI